MKFTQIFGSCLALSFCASTAAYAQSSRIQQSEQFQRRQEITAPAMRLEAGTSVPELYPGENEDVGPQRVLQLKPRRQWFDVFVDTQFYWSDNVNYGGSANELESTVLINTLQAAFSPTGITLRGREFLPQVGVRSQWYNYGLAGASDHALDQLDLDFEAQTIFAEARYAFTSNLHGYAGVEANRLTDQFDYDDRFYREIAPYWRLQWFWRLSDSKILSAAYRGFYHFSATETFAFLPSNLNDRTDHSFTIAYTQEILPRFVVQPYYRFQYTYYTEFNERHEYLHDFGLSLRYHFTNWASVRTFAGYQIKDSDGGVALPDYEKLDLGVGAMLVFRF